LGYPVLAANRNTLSRSFFYLNKCQISPVVNVLRLPQPKYQTGKVKVAKNPGVLLGRRRMSVETRRPRLLP